MKSRDEILQELYDTNFVEAYTRQMCIHTEVVEDFIQEVWLTICGLPETKLQEMYAMDGINGVRKLISGVIPRVAHSTRSMAYYTLIHKDSRNIQQKMNKDKKVRYDEAQGWN